MLKRYVGPYDEVQVYVAGNELGVVKKGEAIAVPDDVATLAEWPADHWQDGEPARPATSKTVRGAD